MSSRWARFSTPLTRELNCTHCWPQHLPLLGVFSLVVTSLETRGRWVQMETTRPCLNQSHGGHVLAFDAWESSRISTKLKLTVFVWTWAEAWFISRRTLLTSSLGLMKLNEWLIGTVMMSLQVRVQLGVPVGKRAATSRQQHVTWPDNVPLCKERHERIH